MIKTDYTREELIALCERAIVAEEDWRYISSPAGQKQIGICWARLKAGCNFTVLTEDNAKKKDTVLWTVTNEHTIWVEVEHKGFVPFRLGRDAKASINVECFYIPTPERLVIASGEDWCH